MVDQQFILNGDQEKAVAAGVKFLRSDGPQIYEISGAAGT